MKKIDWPEGLRTEVVAVPGLMNAVVNLDPADAERPGRTAASGVHVNNGHDGKFRPPAARSAASRR